MTVTAERLAEGISYDDFKARMTRNRERFEANERRVALDEKALAPFRRLHRPLRVLVLAEDWCGDVVQNLPVLGRIARETGMLDLRIFLRDEHPELMDLYLNQGKYRSIPVFVFFDDEMREVGRFIERPASVTELRGRRRAEIYAEHPEFGSPDASPDQLPDDTRAALQAALQAMRDEIAPFAEREVVRELSAIVARAA